MPSQVSLGPLTLNSYTGWVGLLALIGVGLALWRSRRSPAAAYRLILVTSVFALLAGRAGYGALHWSYFAERPAEIFSPTVAGYSEHFALLGAWLAVWLARRRRQPIDPLALAIGASLVGIGASIGCIAHGCGYGREVFWTDGVWWEMRVDWPDATLTRAPRLPTQAMTAVWLAVCAGLAVVAARRCGGCSMAPLIVWIAAFAAGDLVIQSLRAEPSPRVAGWRAQQWLDALILLLIAGSAGAMGWKGLRRSLRRRRLG